MIAKNRREGGDETKERGCEATTKEEAKSSVRSKNIEGV